MKTFAAFSLWLLLAASAFAECKPGLGNANVAVTSKGLWRGLELGDRTYAVADWDLELCRGGANGLELSGEAMLPVTDDGVDLAAVSLQYLRFFGEGNASWLAAGYRQYHWSDAREEWSGEVFASVFHKFQNDRLQEIGLTIWPYVEIAHDFQLFEATYARAGTQHIIGTRGLAATIDLSVSASDYVDSFAFHAAEGSVWLDKSLKGRYEAGVGGGYIWADDEIGDNHAWAGVRFRIK